MKPGIVGVIRGSFRWQEVVAAKRAEAARIAAENPPPKPKGRKKKGDDAAG